MFTMTNVGMCFTQTKLPGIGLVIGVTHLAPRYRIKRLQLYAFLDSQSIPSSDTITI